MHLLKTDAGHVLTMPKKEYYQEIFVDGWLKMEISKPRDLLVDASIL